MNKKEKEKTAWALGGFCLIGALAVDVLCVLFLLDVLQSRWILNTIIGIGILLHIVFSLYEMVRSKWILAGGSLVFALAYIAGMVLYNL